MVRHYFLFKPRPEVHEAYNPLQKLAYTSVILCAALAVATGLLLSKPVQFSAIVSAIGGFQAVRVYHFAAMVFLVAFIPGHLVMVGLHGWRKVSAAARGRARA